MGPEAAAATLATSQERISQTHRGLKRLREEITRWVKLREASDEQRQYVTQLGTLKTQLLYLLDEVERQASGVAAADGVRAVYARCRVIDRRRLWIQRLWGYFQSKFDQRYDERLKVVLGAADDIVWSCYEQPFRAAGAKDRPPHPLPFIAPVYSPYAVPREEPPQDLRSDVDAEFLSSMLRAMPIPVVGIPPQAVDEPWRLAYLAHEVGHHVQFDLKGGALVGSFGEALLAAGGSRWAGWNKELFADVFSLMMIGHWALWAMGELVWSDTAGMLDDTHPLYPCPLVRLMFMAAVADKLGLAGSEALRGLRSAEFLDGGPVFVKKRDVRSSASEDLSQLAGVAEAVTARAEDGAKDSLSALCEFNALEFQSPGGTAYLWGEALVGRANMVDEKTLPSSRLVLSGAVRAWAEICSDPDEAERDRRRAALTAELPAKIVANREEITRTATPPAGGVLTKQNGRLAELLLAGEPPGPGL